MSRTVAELFSAAMELPEAERVELAELLAASVPEALHSLHPAWASELRRRSEDVRSGRVKPVPWDEVMREIHADLAKDDTADG